jgi:hypothetical protein
MSRPLNRLHFNCADPLQTLWEFWSTLVIFEKLVCPAIGHLFTKIYDDKTESGWEFDFLVMRRARLRMLMPVRVAVRAPIRDWLPTFFRKESRLTRRQGTE